MASRGCITTHTPLQPSSPAISPAISLTRLLYPACAIMRASPHPPPSHPIMPVRAHDHTPGRLPLPRRGTSGDAHTATHSCAHNCPALFSISLCLHLPCTATRALPPSPPLPPVPLASEHHNGLHRNPLSYHATSSDYRTTAHPGTYNRPDPSHLPLHTDPVLALSAGK